MTEYLRKNRWKNNRKNNAFLLALTLCLCALVSAPAQAKFPEYIDAEFIAPREKPLTPLDYSFRPELAVFSHKREQLNRDGEFLRDSSLDANIRSYWRDVDYSTAGKANSEAWVLGGELVYNSGWYRDFLQTEIATYISQKLYGPDDKPGSYLLKPVQQSYSTLGKANIKLRYSKTQLSLYRSELNTPFVNRHENYMTPVMYENYTLLSRDINNIDLMTSLVTAWKPRNQSSFKSITYKVNQATDTKNDSDMLILGGNYHYSPEFTIGGIGYHVDDYLDIFYGEYFWQLPVSFADLKLSQQYIHQRSIGKAIDGEFRNNAWGAKLAYTLGAAEWTFTWHSITGDTMRSDWAGYPGYNSAMIINFFEANEQSWGLGLNYDFSQLGAKGWHFSGAYISGDTPDSGSKQSPDETELDLTLQYAFENRFLKNVNIMGRYGRVNRNQGGEDIEDFRLILNYQLPLF